MTAPEARTVRDIEQAELIASSRRVREQLADLVHELEKHVCALQAEISLLQKDSRKEGKSDD